MPPRFPHRLFVCLLLLLALEGCRIDPGAGKGAATVIGEGVVNDPANKSLRFEMLEFGLHEFCRQLLISGAPLRLADDQPVIGRYFADSCQAKSIDEIAQNTIVVQFGGHGYAWTLGTGRIGFRARGLLELAPDFRVHADSMYVYFRPVQVDTSDFEVLMVENPLAESAAQMAGLDAAGLGRAIIDAQLGRGFTVVRYDADGHTDFALGLVNEGEAPFRPYQVLSSPKRTAANGRTELHVGQQDYLGKLHVNAGEAITVTLKVDGAPALDVALVPASGGNATLDRYVREPGPRNPRGPLPFYAQASAVAPFKTEVPLPAGDYYLLLDHSSAFGRVRPAEDALPARVDYLVQVGRSTAR